MKRLFIILLLLSVIGTAHSATLWETTFDCAEWEHTGAGGPSCDDLFVASDSRTGTKITTAANHSSGDGGRGMRQYLSLIHI